MGLETGTFLDDLVVTNPVGATDDVNKGDDHLRLIKSVLKTTFPNATKAFRFESVLTKTTTYPVVAADARALILADASGGIFTITLPLGSTVFAGYSIIIMKSDSGSNAVTVDGNGAETINGTATRTLTVQYQAEKYAWDGSEWKVVSTFTNLVDDTTPQLGGNLDVNGKEITSVSDGNVVINPDGTGIITLGAAVTVDSAGGVNAVITETGIDRNDGGDVTYNIKNSGAGNMALQVDGSEVAKLASPALTGNPTAPTQSAGNSSTRLATTAFVQGEFGSIVTKTADEAVNNSTTLQDDDHLLFAMLANITYFVMVHLLEATLVTNPKLKIGWTVPTGCTMKWNEDWTSSSTDLKTESETLVFPVAATGTHGVKFRAIVKNGANAGNLQMQWAQDTANGNDTTLLKHSNMIVRNLGAT